MLQLRLRCCACCAGGQWTAGAAALLSDGALMSLQRCHLLCMAAY